MANMGVSGFRWDFGIRVDSGAAVNYIQVTDDFQGTAGRWLITTTRTGNDLVVSAPGTGITVTLPADSFHSFSIVVEAGEADAKLLINGVEELDVAFDAQTVTSGLALHTSGSSPSTDEDLWVRDTTLTSLETLEHVLTRAEIESSVRLVVPTVGNPLTAKMPKGSFQVGTNFTVVNGSTKETTLESQDGDSHLFGDKTEYKVQPSALVVLTQEASPRGTSWAVSGGLQKTVHTTGNSLHMMCDATGTVLNRHGTYTGLIDVQQLSTGLYQLRIGSHLFGDSDTTIVPAVVHGSVPHVAVGVFNGGYPEIRVYTLGGTLADNQFTVSIYW